MELPRDKGNNYRVVFAAISGKSGGAGHVTRALAIRNALKRLGYKLDGSEGIEYWLGGSVDNEARWVAQGDPAFMYVHPDGVPAFPTLELQEQRKHEVCWMLDQLKPDLLLIDNSLHFLDYLNTGMYGYTRPGQVWGICRYYPMAYLGVSTGALDRLYQIERFEPDFYNPGICRQQTRSAATKAGLERTGYTPSYDPNDEEYATGRAYQKWLALHATYDRKLVAPVVNVDPAQVFPRDKAREALLALLPENERPSEEDIALIKEGRKHLALVTGRPGYAAEEIDQARFDKWSAEQLGRYNNPVVVRVGMGATNVDNLANLLPGADVIIATSGYNLFYEVRYLKQLGLFSGATYWFPLRERIHDQAMRSHFSREWGGPGVYPDGNGADYLARAILIKAGLLNGNE